MGGCSLGRMAAPAPKPHLAALGVVPGPGLADQLKELARQDVLNYYKLSIVIILELHCSSSGAADAAAPALPQQPGP